MDRMIDKYLARYNDMATSGNPYKMKVFGEAEKAIFGKMVAEHPDIAEEWLEMLEASRFNNYLSEEEAETIVSHLANEDGSKAPHWSRQEVKQFVESIGGKMECEPYYNSCALYATMNMLYSDHAPSITEYLPNTTTSTKFIYKMSLEKLRDKDRPHFIREYFHL